MEKKGGDEMMRVKMGGLEDSRNSLFECSELRKFLEYNIRKKYLPVSVVWKLF